MAVTIQDVRNFLSKLPVQRVEDATITLTLRVANTVIDATKSGKATTQQIDDAVLVYAAWQTLIAYATEMERSAGVVPAPVMTHQTVLENLANHLLEIVKRGAPIYVAGVEQPDTFLQQYIEGGLQESHDFY
jgi:hypothetical protein